MTIFKLSLLQTKSYRDSDGYEITEEKEIGYYLNRETAEKHLHLYCKWNHINREKMSIRSIEVEEE